MERYIQEGGIILLTMPINENVIKYIQGFSNPFLDKFFQAITMLGEQYIFVTIMVIIFWSVNKKLGYRLAFVCLTSMVINIILKDSFMVLRPIGEEGIRSLRIETATGYSFPSGHTQIVATLWITLMLYTKKNFVYINGTIIIILVGISRIYLGVHRPMDVIGAIIIAVVWVFICNAFINYVESGNKKSLLLFIIIPIFIGMLFTNFTDYFKMTGILIGIYIGYLIEPKHIAFENTGKYIMQIFKIVIGLGLLLVLESTLELIFLKRIFSDFIRYLLMGLWVTIGAPLIFNKIEATVY